MARSPGGWAPSRRFQVSVKGSGSSRVLDQLQAGTVLFAYLTDRHHGAAQGSQTAKFLLDLLEPFMPPPVSHLIRGCIPFSLPILLVQFMDFGNLTPQADDFLLENS